MPRLYRYVGSRPAHSPPGTPIRSHADLTDWLRSQPTVADTFVVTFVIDEAGTLLVADRHSEHVACAASKPVLSAGEITFQITPGETEVIEITNQSTGYCPEPSSWAQVRAALDRIKLNHPGRFTSAFQFRRCVKCDTLNLIKDELFECAVCEAELPAEYNCQT